ncbi:hypothetical protein JD77_04905 [Micromonospora olivasterospora]|uniref:Uncharacterized protein n=1 Tax=Micromonospora olivasterospora TaxID=1880 RepID=A0A562IGD5_MICOL|nr:hypothetical protein JD77_04905 [Micromonospora olivasterospora]
MPAVDRLERRLPFALPLAGWAAARADTTGRRLAVTAGAVLTVPGFFGEPAREALVVAGFALLVWVPALPSRRAVNRAAALLAGGSLYVHLTHWQVWPLVAPWSRWAALVASLAVGIGCAALARLASRRLPAVLRRARPLAARAAPR